jgi:hypothetical protein
MQTYSFGDARLDRRADIITEQIVATGSLVPRRFGGGRKGELAAGRFLDSPKVTPEAILQIHVDRTAAAAQGRRRIVAIQDTTEVNFSGRDRSRTGLGPGADGKAKGFFLHATVAVDPDSEQIVGVLDAQIWTRPPAGRRKRRQACAVEEKETMRWITAMKCAHLRLLRAATKRIHITDREGDFYPLLARVPAGDDLVIRARHNRKMPAGGRLFAEAGAWPDLGVSEIVVPPRGPGDKPRLARVALRAARVRLGKPASRIATLDPDEIEIGLVEVREIDPPAGAKAVHWRLLTTLPTATREEAAEVVRLYRLRWRIEQVFRALKSDGLALEETQVQAADRLFKLAALGLTAAVRILQLVDARDGCDRPATDAIDAKLIEPAAAIGKTLEGKTKRQQNPHAKGTLGWLSWIAARLGGWNCYYKKPGPKTMAIGWRQLAAMIAGFVIAKPDLAVHGADV